MSNIKRMAIVLVAVALVALVASSFKGSDVLDRSIILGVGVDAFGDYGIQLTVEVVSPGNGSEQVGTFSKTVTVEAKTISQDIQNVAEYTGKEASLGQCVVLILGQDYYENVDFTDLIEYFINHHSLKESTAICCCEGSAKDLLNNGGALAQSVSLAIATAMLDQTEKIAVSTNNLLKYTRSQNELDCTGFLNKVTFVPSENKDAQDSDKVMGYFTYRELAVFRGNRYVCDLNEEEVRGMSLFVEDVVGETFVSYQDEYKRTLQVNNKDVEQKRTDNGGFDITITISVRFGRTDSEEVSGILSSKKNDEIDPKLLDDVQQQAMQLATAFLAKQAEYNFDLLKFHESYRQKQGTSDQLAHKPTADFPVNLTIKVEEN